jgi:hypothetical protein
MLADPEFKHVLFCGAVILAVGIPLVLWSVISF